MTCAELVDRLDDYVDRTLPEAERPEVERHLQGCAACREEERQLRGLLGEASALAREITPERDLWPGIAERIRPERSGKASLPQGRWWSPVGLAAAAAVVMAIVSSLVSREAAPTASPVPTTPVRVEESALREAEADYARATSALLAALHQRHDLSPETMASVQRNLDVIDQALGEVLAAPAKDPGNPELTRMLAATHRKKVDVLRRVVRLSTQL